MAKHHDKDFKEQAIQYYNDHPELSKEQIIRNLGISRTTLYKWLEEAEKNDGEVQYRGSGNYQNDYEKEIVKLKKELKAKDDALEILKKAISIMGENELK